MPVTHNTVTHTPWQYCNSKHPQHCHTHILTTVLCHTLIALSSRTTTPQPRHTLTTIWHHTSTRLSYHTVTTLLNSMPSTLSHHTLTTLLNSTHQHCHTTFAILLNSTPLTLSHHILTTLLKSMPPTQSYHILPCRRSGDRFLVESNQWLTNLICVAFKPATSH